MPSTRFVKQKKGTIMKSLALTVPVCICLGLVGGAYGQFGGITPAIPDDPLFPPSTLSPFGQESLWATEVTYAWSMVGYNQPWTVDHNNRERTIAFIDTGIDTSHPEFGGDGVLPSKIHPDSRSFVEGGADFGSQFICGCVPNHYSTADVEDNMWEHNLNPHGTIVAGIAGAYAQNSEGIAGVCWDCSLLVLRVSVVIDPWPGCTRISEGCSYSPKVVADAIRFAAGWDPGEDVNDPTSWGAIRARTICTAIEGNSIYDDLCADATPVISPVGHAIDQAYSRGCVVVAIAGNTSGATGNPPCWQNPNTNAPNCNPRTDWVPLEIISNLAFNPKTITVGGACRDGTAWHCQSQINPPMSALGACGPFLYPNPAPDGTAPVLSVVAPSEDMISTYPDNTYEFLGELNIGTSWAAPQVAGVVALMLGEDPSLTPKQVKYILEVTATDIDAPGYDRFTGYGLLNARASIEYVQKQQFPGDWDGDGLVAPIDAVLYAVDLAAGNMMTDLNLDAVQAADDMTIFLDSYAGN